jgi:cytochrome c biogenesis protein CcdA
MSSNSGFFSRLVLILGSVMAFVYIGLGILLLVTDLFPVKPEALKIGIGVFFLVYGPFRIYRQFFRKSEPNEK